METKMKALILAGGLGTRISEESGDRPKPMIEVGGRPILWHIMKMYSSHGVNDFVILCGYKGYLIKEYFSNYFLHMSDVTFDMINNKMVVHRKKAEPWTVTLVDTGEFSNTGGRLMFAKEYVKDEEDFCFTYGDGVSDVDIAESIAFHVKHGKKATITGVVPPGRYGALVTTNDQVTEFTEKPPGDLGSLINGGFFILKPSCIDLINSLDTSWEEDPLKKLAKDGDLQVFRHQGFWHAMDTLRDKTHLEGLWKSGEAPWKTWT
jgi:glucose-1-phosphate cytidylyltransferase